MTKKIIYILLAIFSLGIVASFSFKGGNGYLKKWANGRKSKVLRMILEKKIAQEALQFRGETGIVIKDLAGNWQILINPHKLFPAASLVKVPLMATYFYAANKGKLRLDETIRLKRAHKVLGSGVLKYAPVGTEVSLEKLIALMISESDNTATNMLIERLGFTYLNDGFKRLDLKDTNISRRLMDFKGRREGRENFTTAYDLANLLEEIYNGRLLDRVTSRRCLDLLKMQKIRDRIPARLPLKTPVAHKTGLERGICHDAGIVFTDKGDYLICVLTKHQDKTSKLAKDFITQLAYDVYSYYQGL